MKTPHRTRVTSSIDAQLLAEMQAEATRRGMPVERYVEQFLAATLPAIIAQEMTDYVNRSIQLANTHDTPNAIECKEDIPNE